MRRAQGSTQMLSGMTAFGKMTGIITRSTQAVSPVQNSIPAWTRKHTSKHTGGEASKGNRNNITGNKIVTNILLHAPLPPPCPRSLGHCRCEEEAAPEDLARWGVGARRVMSCTLTSSRSCGTVEDTPAPPG